MKICFNSFKILTLAGVMAASVASCKRSGSYTPVAKESIPERTTVVLDSLVREGKKISENSDYVYLGSDTLELPENFTENPASFFTKASLKLRDKCNDKVVCIDESSCIFDNANRIGNWNNYHDMYIDKVVIIPKSEIYSKGSKKYVLGNYMGRTNPKITNFL